MMGASGDIDMLPLPIPFRRVVFVLALVKAGVAGAGLGLAALGAADVAFAVSAVEWWNAVRPESLINTFAGVGGGIGVIWRIANAIFG